MHRVTTTAAEIVGTATRQDRLTKAGQVQQHKGAERLEAVKAELDADAHEAKATTAGRTQKSAQKTKEAVNS